MNATEAGKAAQVINRRGSRMIEDAHTPTVYGNETNLEAAAYGAAGLVVGASTGSTNTETPAGSQTFRAETFTLSGGGPGSDITFIIDDGYVPGFPQEEVREAFYTYYDGGRTATVRLDRADAIDVYLALTRQPASV